MPQGLQFDVVILGAGPAGSVLAHGLCSRGYSVAIIERESFPRYAIGESLPASIALLLKRIGIIAPSTELDFPRSKGYFSAWGSTDLRFTPHDRRDTHRGFQAERSRFDNLLFSAARDSGAQVFENCRITELRHADSGWTAEIDDAGKRAVTLNPRFLCDATGRARILTRKLRLPIRHCGDQIALAAYWKSRLPKEPGRPDNVVESLPNGWSYSAWFAPDRAVMGFVTDRSALPENLRGHAAANYRNAIESTLHVRKNVGDAEQDGEIRIFPAHPSLVEECCGPDWLLAGDAASTLDPLCSQGVQKAIGSALTAVTVVHTIFQHPERRAISQEFYRSREASGFRSHLSARARYYAREKRWAEQPFWQSRLVDVNSSNMRRQPRTEWSVKAILSLAHSAEISVLPVVENGFVESRPVLCASHVERGLRYCRGVLVPEIAELLASKPTAEELAKSYRLVHPETPQQLVYRALEELWAYGIVECAPLQAH